MNTIRDGMKTKKRWVIRRYNNIEEARADILPTNIIDGKGRMLPGVSEIKGNVLLNEGINNVLGPLLTGTGTPTVYDNANTRLGVGDNDTAATASQTGLQSTNKTYAAMASGYPTFASQIATWRAEFGGTEANHAWKEFTVVNGADDTGDNFNRKVSDQGTKASGQVWTLTLEITFS